MFNVGTREREIFDDLMLDRDLRSKFNPKELETLVERIASPLTNEIQELLTEIEGLEDQIENFKAAIPI